MRTSVEKINFQSGSKTKRSQKPARGKGTDYVYKTLRDLIVRTDLPPGEKIDEAALT